MLAVGVDPAAERVAALVRLAIARGDSGAQAAVLPERDDDRTGLARAIASAVASVEPSSITSTSTSGSTVASSASTPRRFSSSFQRGMNTTVSGRELIAGGYSEESVSC